MRSLGLKRVHDLVRQATPAGRHSPAQEPRHAACRPALVQMPHPASPATPSAAGEGPHCTLRRGIAVRPDSDLIVRVWIKPVDPVACAACGVHRPAGGPIPPGSRSGGGGHIVRAGAGVPAPPKRGRRAAHDLFGDRHPRAVRDHRREQPTGRQRAARRRRTGSARAGDRPRRRPPASAPAPPPLAPLPAPRLLNSSPRQASLPCSASPPDLGSMPGMLVPHSSPGAQPPRRAQPGAPPLPHAAVKTRSPRAPTCGPSRTSTRA